MMRYKAWIIPLPLLVIGVAVLWATPRGEASVIEGLYAKLDRSVERRDAGAIRAVLTPDAVVKTSDGRKMNRDMYVEMALLRGAFVHDIRMKTTVEKTTGDSQKLVAFVKNQTCGIGQGPSDGPVQFVTVSTARDTWVRTKTGWKLQSSIGLKQSTTVDGKPFPMPVNSP